MSRFSNHLPEPSADFPMAWVDEFRAELLRSGLRRVGLVAVTLIALELLLLAVDLYRVGTQHDPLGPLLVWRLSALVFLLSYWLLAERLIPEAWRLRYFLVAGTFFTCWASAVMADINGDLSTFTIGMLGVAAACPLPGRFNATLFTLAGAALLAWLAHHFPRVGPYWPSNIVATCVIGVVIEHFTFDAALREFSQRKGIERQRERADTLLYNVFPESVAASLKEGRRSVASHGEVTILFADVVGFSQLATRLLPSQLLDVLEKLFGEFDRCAARHGVEKIKTIGDAYMAIAGAPVAVDHQVERMADFALDIVQVCQDFSTRLDLDLAVRVGIHTGPVIAGVIGSSRLCYDLWGDSVNLAQRLESQGEPNAICVSEPVYYKLREQYRLSDRGLVELKGKGPTRSYLLHGRA